MPIKRGSLVETVEESVTNRRSSDRIKLPEIVSLAKLEKQNYQRINTGLEEFNRVLGGGVVIGSIVLVSGDPGIGKSTLLTQLALNVPNTIYMAGEESAHQIKIRVYRINLAPFLTSTVGLIYK